MWKIGSLSIRLFLWPFIDKNVNHLVAKSVDSDGDSEESEEYEVFSEMDWTSDDRSGKD